MRLSGAITDNVILFLSSAKTSGQGTNWLTCFIYERNAIHKCFSNILMLIIIVTFILRRIYLGGSNIMNMYMSEDSTYNHTILYFGPVAYILSIQNLSPVSQRDRNPTTIVIHMSNNVEHTWSLQCFLRIRDSISRMICTQVWLSLAHTCTGTHTDTHT